MYRPRSIDFQKGPDGMLLSHFTEDFLRILRDLGLEPWRIGTGGGVAAASRRPVPKATMPRANRKGGQGVMTAFPRLLSGCHWIPFWTCFW